MKFVLLTLLFAATAAIRGDARKCPPMEPCDDFHGCIEKDSNGCMICNCPAGQGIPIYIPPAGPRYHFQHRSRRSCPPMEPCENFEGCVDVDKNGCPTCGCPAGKGISIYIPPAGPKFYSERMDSKKRISGKDDIDIIAKNDDINKSVKNIAIAENDIGVGP